MLQHEEDRGDDDVLELLLPYRFEAAFPVPPFPFAGVIGVELPSVGGARFAEEYAPALTAEHPSGQGIGYIRLERPAPMLMPLPFLLCFLKGVFVNQYRDFVLAYFGGASQLPYVFPVGDHPFYYGVLYLPSVLPSHAVIP